ncbi:formate dehydrogenase accessory protein FdhE [Dehalobacter sp. TBBPA1]|uniref:formate dehydrogenase accessory protein FdhE domain-containing protein n=1 Tax=Dehalobacter sp. TBBPA1 TaxID=3235037 RepID=UPI0034A52CDF
MHLCTEKIDGGQATSLSAVKENYLKMRAEITAWQKENNLKDLKLPSRSGQYPLFTINDLPENAIIDLWDRLNIVAEEKIDHSKLAVLQDEFSAGRIQGNEPLFSRLSLAIAGVAQAVYQQLPISASVDDQPMCPCPVCGEDNLMTTLDALNGKRFLHCLVCGNERPIKISGCIHCGSENSSQQTYLNSAEFPGVEVVVCLDCGQYFKEIDLRERRVEDLDWENIRTLPLHYAAEQWILKNRPILSLN